ncbi:MAG: hypothetical protein JXA24_03745 [Proteobacteria bacterium]|nr:hypothetical protein [Pseudomonadota bacterium]
MKSVLRTFIAIATAALPAISFAAQRAVPQVIGFHSAIHDEGGNPIADGEWGVAFRIKDALGETVYEESQRVTAVGGGLSALIGNGLDANGAPTGGVPVEAIDPVQGLYLEVEVEGHSPISGMELASVPYCGYSQVALSAAAGSVGFEALASGAVDEIARQLTGGVGSEAIVLRDELVTVYSSPESASYIGVASDGLGYSESGDLQRVLDDLDSAIAANAQTIAQEAAQRISADAQKVSRTGDTMTGPLTMNADIVMADGGTIDGYDVGSELGQLISRTSTFTKVIWGSALCDTSPAISGPGVSITWLGINQCRIDFNPPMPGGTYALVVTPIPLSFGEPEIPRIEDKGAGGFVAKNAIQFDFVAIGQ